MSALRIERVVVTGGRRFADAARIEADLRALLPLGLKRLAHGGARGADSLADAAARRVLPLECFQRAGSGIAFYEAEWERGSRQAGPRRNIRMLEREAELARVAGESLVVLAYPDPDSRGTWHCVREAIKRDIPVVIWATWSQLEAADLAPIMRGDDGLRHHAWAPDLLTVPDYLEVLGA